MNGPSAGRPPFRSHSPIRRDGSQNPSAGGAGSMGLLGLRDFWPDVSHFNILLILRAWPFKMNAELPQFDFPVPRAEDLDAGIVRIWEAQIAFTAWLFRRKLSLLTDKVLLVEFLSPAAQSPMYIGS